MKCTVNGKPVVVMPETTLTAYLAAAGLPEVGLVVERNGGIVAPEEWPTTVLADADHIEIVSFVAGG